jgi:O-antigen/teichoic acid export membrane protein
LIGVRLLSDLMSPAAYGEVALLIGLLTLGRNLFAYPFLQAAIRFYPEVLPRREVAVLKRIVLIFLNRSSAILAIVAILVGAPIYGWKPMSLLQLPLMIGLLFVDNLRGLESDLQIAARRPRAFACIRASESIFRAIGAVVMVRWLGPAPAMVLLGYLLGGTASYACLFLFQVERVGVSERVADLGPAEPSFHALRERIWRYSVPMIPIAIMDWISGLSDRYFVGGIVGLEAAGIYVAAYGLVTQPFAITQTTLELIFRSRFFDAVTADDAGEARKIFIFWITLQAVICTIGVLAVAVLSKTITLICLGVQYQAAWRVMPFIAAGSAFLALYATLEKVFHARQNTAWCLTLRAIGAALSGAVGLPLILAYGIIGAALAVPVYYGLQVLFTVVVIRMTTGAERVGRRTATCEAVL